MRLELLVEKHWRWFYTYFSYREVYPVKTPYTMVKPEEVLAEDEIRRIARGEDSDTLKRRYDTWVMRNLLAEYFLLLDAHVGDLHDSGFTSAMLNARKHELLLAMTGERGGGPARDIEDVLSSYMGGSDAKAKPFANDTLTPAGARAMLALMQTVYGPAAARVPARVYVRSFVALRELVSYPTNIEASFTNTVELPGLLLASDAAEVKGSSATWRFTMKQLSMRPFVMTAESRTVNTTAFIVTGAIALVAIALLALRFMGRFPGRSRSVTPAPPGADPIP
jgi:hypothetical protein